MLLTLISCHSVIREGETKGTNLCRVTRIGMTGGGGMIIAAIFVTRDLSRESVNDGVMRVRELPRADGMNFSLRTA